MLDATHDRRQKQATILQAVIHPHILSPAAITSVVVTDESMLFLTYDRDVSNYQAQAGTRLPFYCPPWLQKELSTKTRHKYNSHWNSGNGIGIWIEYGDFDKEKKSERLRLEMERYSPPFSAAFAYGCAIEWAFAHLSKQRGIFHPANKKLHSHKNKIRSVIAGVTYLTSQKFLDVPFTALTSLRKLSIEHRSNNLVCHCANSDDPRLIVLRLTVFKFGRDGQHSEKGPKPVENMLLTDVKDQVYSGWFVVNRSRTHETLAVPASKTEDSLTTKIDDNSNPLCFESPLSGLEKFMEFSKGMRVPARDYWTVLRDIFWNHTVLSICSVSDNSIALLAKREPISSSFYRCNTDGSNEEICGEDFPFLLMPNAELIYMVISLNSLISSSPLVERSFSLCLNSENLKSSATYVSPFHLEFVSTSHSWSGSTWRPQQEHKFAYYPQQTCIRGITSSNSDDHDIFDLNAELYEISEFAEHSDQFETYTVQEDLSPLFMDRKKDNLGPARVLIPRSSRKRMWERLYGLGSNDKPEIFIVTKTEVMRVPLHDLKVMESPLKGSNMTKYERDGLADLVNLDIASELRDIAFQWLCRITDESSEFFGTLLCRHFRVRFSRVNSEVPIIDTIKDCMQRAIKDRHCYPASSSDSSLISTKSARIERVMKRPFSEDILVLTSDPLCACCFFIDQKRWSCRFISSKRSTHFVSASWDSTGKTLTIILSDGSIRVLNEYLAIMKASTTCDALAGIFKQQEVQHTFTKRLCKHHFETVILSVVLAGKAGQRGGLLTVKAECTRNFTRKVYNILQCSSVNHLVSEGERVCENFMSLLNGTASQGFRPLPFMWSAMDCIENSLDALMQLMQSGDSKQFSTMYANNLAYFWYSVLCRLADLSDENNAILRFPVLLNAIGWWGLYLGYRSQFSRSLNSLSSFILTHLWLYLLFLTRCSNDSCFSVGIHKLVLRHYGHSGLETLGSLHRDIAITQEMTKYYLAGYSAVHLPEHMEDDFANLDKHLAAANIDHNKRRGSQNLLAGLARDIERRALELAK